MISEVRKKAEKRSTEIIIFAVILAAGTAATTYNNTNILDAGTSTSNGLVAEYRFDTGAGDTGYDTAGNNDGTINGAAWTQGVKAGAIGFISNGDQVIVDDDSSLEGQTDGITVSFWFYSRQDNVGDWSIALGKGAFANDPYAMIIDNVQPDSFRFNPTLGDQSGNFYRANINSIPHRRWTHLVMRYNPDSGDMTVYRNGKLRDTTNVGDIDLAANSKDLQFGEGGAGGYIHGKLDDARIYNKPLNKSQIKSLYNSGSWRIGTVTGEDDSSKVLDISFQHQNSSHVYDISGYENHGTREGGVGQESAVGCKVGRCYSFDGIDDHVNLGDSLVDGQDQVTVMAWVRPDSIDSDSPSHGKTGNGNAIIDKSGSTDDNIAFLTGSNDELYFYLDTGSDNSIASTSSPLNIGEWTHVTGVYNGSLMRIFADGKLLGKTSATGPIISNGNDLNIGMEDENAQHFEGKIDQVKIFNRSLSQSEIVEKTQGLDSSGAVLDLRFNRDGGDKAYDFSGEKNHGTLQPDASTGPEWIDGVNGNGLRFDGGDDRLDTTLEELDSGDTAHSVCLWYRLNEVPSSRVDPVSIGDASENEYSSVDVFSDRIQWYFYSNDVSINHKANPGKWEHLCLAYEGGGGTVENKKMYLNGEERQAYDSGGDKANLDLPADPKVGVGYDRGRNAAHFPGSIDNVRVFSYPLSKSKARQLYSQGKSRVGSPSGSSSSINLRDGLVLSQTFNRIETCGQSDTVSCPSGVSGEVAVDESGEANHGELVKGPTLKGAEDCRVGGCLGFDAEDDTVRVDRDSSIVSGSRSISFWVNLNGELSQGSWEDIVGQGSMRVEVDEADSTTLNWYTTGGAGSFGVPNNEWVHVTVTANSDTAKMYTDGNLVGSFSVDTLNEPSGDLWIMSEESFKYVGGKIDQVRIYNRSLSNQEVWNLYTNGRDKETGMAGPMGWWRMDSINSGSTPDLAEGNDGAVSGANLVSGKVGKALEFDGSDDGVNVGNPSMDLTRSLSICLWIKPDDMSAQRENPIDKAYGGEFSFTLEDSSQGVLSTYFGSAGDNAKPYATNRWSNVFQNDKWSHICWVRNNSAQDAKLYKNGADWSSYQTSSEWETPSQSSDSIQIGNGYTNSFDGSLDDVRIYPYALNQKQVKQVMNSGAVSVG